MRDFPKCKILIDLFTTQGDRQEKASHQFVVKCQKGPAFRTLYFRKISKLQKPNYSETCKNEKFGKFHLKQGLNVRNLFSIYTLQHDKLRQKWHPNFIPFSKKGIQILYFFSKKKM